MSGQPPENPREDSACVGVRAEPATVASKHSLESRGQCRRDFLKLGGLASAGLVLGAPAVARAATANAPSDTLNVGFIGLGKQHEVLFNAMKNIPGLRFKAVCDIMKYRVGTSFSRIRNMFDERPNRYLDAGDMLAGEKDLDVVVVATPDNWHAPHTVMALEAGCHVYCEKMMSNTLEGARGMVDAMERTGRLCQIGHQRRSNPRYLHTYENLIRKAEIPGRITNINGQWNRAVSPDLGWPKKYEIPQDTLEKYGYKNMHQFRNWRWFKDLSGGPISDLGAHQIDIYNWFLDAYPKTIMASGGADYYPEREWYDNVMTIFEYDTRFGPVRAFYQTLTTTSAGGGYFEYFMGDEGAIRMSENPSLTKVFREERAPDWDKWISLNYIRKTEAPPPKEDGKIDVRETAPLVSFEVPIVLDKPPHQPHLENFFAAIHGKAKLNADGEHSFKSEAAIFRVNEAVAKREIIECPPSMYKL